MSDAERIPRILSDLAVDGLVMNYKFAVPPRLVTLLDEARLLGEAAVAMLQRLLSGTKRVAASALPMRLLPGSSCTPPS